MSGESDYELWSKLKPERRPEQSQNPELLEETGKSLGSAIPASLSSHSPLHLHSCFPLHTCRHHFRNIQTLRASGCSHTPPIIQQIKSMHVCIAANIQKICSNIIEL